MHSRMEYLLEELPGLLSDNDAALKYLAQFSYMEQRRLQDKLIFIRGNTNITFLEATQETIEQELNYAYMDSRNNADRLGGD